MEGAAAELPGGGANTLATPAATPTRDPCRRPLHFAISYRLGHAVPGEDEPRRICQPVP